MTAFKVPAPPSGPVPWDKRQAMATLSDMLRVRRMEEKAIELYGQQKIRGFLHLYIGEEAVATGALRALQAQDNVVATYREHGHALSIFQFRYEPEAKPVWLQSSYRLTGLKEAV
jgi:pyruvate dehydrogenase E1 component alpha subunit